VKRLARNTALSLSIALTVTACATDEYGNRVPMSDTQKGGLIGAGVGAAVGALVADKAGKGALIGAVGGGIAGALVGNYMDSQKRDLQKVLRPEMDAGAITLQTLPDNHLLIAMTGATAFDTDSSLIKAGFLPTLDKLAGVVNRYGKTQLVVVGHTDSTGSLQHNMDLSEQRARAVQDYLLAQQVIPQRLSSAGVGPKEPRASNETAEGRALNRRVELTVIPVVADR
jgi:outer membrane protein OmpA-like peptidoglycan-associated protein